MPLTVSGRQSMTAAEVAKWAQETDPPVEGDTTAIFPPDEPEGWPASDYRRATIYYLDGEDRTVNVATPAGGITAAEYDNHGDTIRTLSADNLALALKAGSKSAEVAKPLYTESKYNSEGTELQETVGPEHKVKLPSGSEVEARKQVKYVYDEEGAPGGGAGPYRLVTETTEAADVVGYPKAEDKRTVKDSYSGQEGLGWKLHEPTSTTVAPGSLNLVHSTLYSSTTGAETETAMPGSSAKEPAGLAYFSQFGATGSEAEKLAHPSSVAIDAHGDVLVTDASHGRVEEFSSSGTYMSDYGTAGSGSDQFKEPDGIAINATTKNVYVSDWGNNRVDQLNEKGEFVRAFGYGVSNGEAKLQTCTTTCKAGIAGSAAGQLDDPDGLTINSSGNVLVADYANNRIDKFTETGGFVAAYGFGVSNGEEKLQTCTTTCKVGIAGNGNGQFHSPDGVTIAGADIVVSDLHNNRLDEFNSSMEYVGKLESIVPGGGANLSSPSGVAAGPGNNVYATELGSSRVVEFVVTGGASVFGSSGTGPGQLKEPAGLAISTAGDMYVADPGNTRVDEWTPSLTGNSGSYSSQTIYYTPKTEATVAACQNHKEWANLPCETTPAQQPEVAGMPALPVTTYTYNIFDEPEVTKSTTVDGSEAATRTETDSYDNAGRLTGKETTSSTGTTLAKLTYAYSTTTGILDKQTSSTGSGKESITEEYNRAGQLTSYTNANGATTTYEYEKEKDERPTTITDEKGSQTFGYNETTGQMTSLKDSGAGTFTASYDPEGNLIGETTPNGLAATTSRNPVGEPTALEYAKGGSDWLSDDVVPSIHGQWLGQTSTLATDSYSYNEAGWLTKVQETPTGGKCATRLYEYNADGDRTTLTKRPPASGGGCGTEGGEVQEHHYDTADRLLDSGTTYDPFGDITALPAADAGGSELKSSFYADGQLASQEQPGEAIAYSLDPARRTDQTISTGEVASNVADEYDGPGNTPAWLDYTTTGEWTRNIFGIAGTLVATQNDTETPVLQIANLHGDIIGTVPDSETATKLASALETTEYGVPTVADPPPDSWLGASALRTELPSGVVDMGARSYVPEIGRFLQPDPQPGGSADAYAYTHGDPLNESDPSGELSIHSTSGGLSAVGTGEGVQLPNGEGIGTDAVIPPPPDLQLEEAFDADPPWDQITAGYEEYEEFEEYEEGEEEGYEEAAYHQGAGGNAEAQVQSGVLYQPLEGSAREARPSASPPPRCLNRGRTSLQAASPCLYYVGFFGEFIKGVKNVAKGAAHAVVHAVRAVVRWARQHYSSLKSISCNISGAGAGILTGVGVGILTKSPFSGGAAGAAVDRGVTYACEHQ